MRLIKFDNDEYYHVYNRGNNKQTLFYDTLDYQFFLICLFRYNTVNKVRSFNNENDRLVSVVSYTLLPNHFHLMLRQEVEDGISEFMYRLQRSFSLYSNRKRGRVGTIYEGPFKAKHVSTEAYFDHLPRYIHLNIVDLLTHEWRNGNISNWKEAMEVMANYPWSSHASYLTKQQGLPILNMDIINDLFPSKSEYETFIRTWAMSDTIIAKSLVAEGSF